MALAQLRRHARLALVDPENPGVVVYVAVGGVFAGLIFAVSVVSLPMILDRQTDAISAGLTSFRLVLTQPLVMLWWGLIITTLVVLAMLPWFAGLLVAGPQPVRIRKLLLAGCYRRANRTNGDIVFVPNRGDSHLRLEFVLDKLVKRAPAHRTQSGHVGRAFSSLMQPSADSSDPVCFTSANPATSMGCFHPVAGAAICRFSQHIAPTAGCPPIECLNLVQRAWGGC